MDITKDVESSEEQSTESTQDSNEVYEKLKEAIGEIYRQETEQIKKQIHEELEELTEEVSEKNKESMEFQEQLEESIEVSKEERIEESIEDYDRELVNIQKSKKKRIKAKKLELITDTEELAKHKHYEYSHAIGAKIDTYNIQKQDTKTKRKRDQTQKVAKKKVHVKAKKLELVTDAEELSKHKHYEYSHTIGRKIDTKSISKQDKKPLKKAINSKVSIQKKKPISAKKLELTPTQDTRSTTNNSTTNKSSEESQTKPVKQSVDSSNKKIEKPITKHTPEEIIRLESGKRIENEVSKELIEEYRQETSKRPFYNKKETRDFKKWLEAQKEKQKKEKGESEKAKKTKEVIKPKEDWTILLERWINQADEKEISEELKEEILRIINNYNDLREYYKRLYDLLIKSFKKEISNAEKKELEILFEKFKRVSPLEKEIFRNLQAFRVFYYENIKWHKYLIKVHHKTFTSHLAQKLKKLKEIGNIEEYLEKSKIELNWKELINNNLDSISNLNADEKEIIKQIITKNNITEQEIRKLSSILSRLDTNKLVEIFGQSFNQHTKNYVRWGWDFDQGVKRKIIYDYLSKIEFERSTYSTEEFVLDIKKEVSSLLSEYISNERLGFEILNQKKSHIKSILEYCRKDPKYLLTGELLNNWEIQLKKIPGDRYRLKKYFDKYKTSNKILNQRHWVLYSHPNLKLNYFENIDTPEVAYWFGLLFADGSLYILKPKNRYGKRYDRYIISLQLSVNDGILIKKFINAIGFNPKYVEYEKKILTNKNTGEERIIRTFRMRFSNKLFAQNMINNGYVVGKKSKKIRLPKLADRNLYLAFLLGFFDGDGKGGTTRITTGSRLFLNDIKSLFGLKYKIHSYKYLNKAGEERISYSSHLGADLFNEMLDNYINSLPRKRKRFIGIKTARELMIPTSISGPVKFKFSKEELKELVKKMSRPEIVKLHYKRFGIKITSNVVSYWRNKWEI